MTLDAVSEISIPARSGELPFSVMMFVFDLVPARPRSAGGRGEVFLDPDAGQHVSGDHIADASSDQISAKN
jgi:hypothetical protein